MSVQMIFCMETNKKADTDSIYITELLYHMYTITNKIKISKVYMSTKSKYNSKDVKKEIEKKIKAYTLGNSVVIYCIDTDEFETNFEQKKELEDVSDFCKKAGYELIWFCHDVEEVFQGKKISDSEKVKEAAGFRRKKMIQEVDCKKLSSSSERKQASNILTVLDKYLVRK